MMRTYIVVLLVAGMFGLGGSLAFGSTPSAVISTPGLSEEAAEATPTIATGANNDMESFYSRISDFGIQLKPLEGVPSVTEDIAIAVAKHNAPIAGDAEHITAMYTSFSDYPAGPDGPPLIMPGTSRVMKDVPVWIVTFHGAHILHSGPCMIDASGNEIPSTRDPYVFGDANVVLDAETGEVLEGFSYNTPSIAGD
ncbi:MAG: hypothetical protein ACPL2N_06855 [Candidatus Cryosericum sp.]